MRECSAWGASELVDLHLGLSPPGGPSRGEAAAVAPAAFDFQMDTRRGGRHELADQRPRELAEREVYIYIYIYYRFVSIDFYTYIYIYIHIIDLYI
jgi:hypothetical protein